MKNFSKWNLLIFQELHIFSPFIHTLIEDWSSKSLWVESSWISSRQPLLSYSLYMYILHSNGSFHICTDEWVLRSEIRTMKNCITNQSHRIWINCLGRKEQWMVFRWSVHRYIHIWMCECEESSDTYPHLCCDCGSDTWNIFPNMWFSYCCTIDIIHNNI